MNVMLDSLALPADLEWTDEFDWTPVGQNVDTTLKGSLVVETSTKQAGRPITLNGGEDAAWIDRATLEALYAKAETGATMTLGIPGRGEREVVFRHEDTPIEAEPVFRQADPGDDHLYTIRLRFLEV